MVSEKNTKQELLDEYKRLIAEAKTKKITVPADAKGMNVKNTKADILNAIQSLENALQVTPAESEKPAVPKPAPVSAPEKPYAPEIRKTPTKTPASAKEDNELSYLKTEIKDEIDALETAKALKKQEYNELLEIQKELEKFVTMINSNKNKNLELEKSQAEQKEAQEKKAKEETEACDALNEERLKSANDALEQLEKDIADKKAALEADRKAETEDYIYRTSQKQKMEDDAWDDELKKRKEAIAEIQAETAKLQADIDSKAALVAELNAKIDEIPALIEQAKKDGADAKEKELGRDYGYKTHMANKDAEVKVQSLQKQIERLKTDYDAVLAEKTDIQTKLDKAREASNTLYMATVQSTGGVKFLKPDKN